MVVILSRFLKAAQLVQLKLNRIGWYRGIVVRRGHDGF
jgi:hypothetical protein